MYFDDKKVICDCAGYDVDSVENKVSSLRSSNLVKTSEDTGFLDVSTVISVDNVKIVSLGNLQSVLRGLGDRTGSKYKSLLAFFVMHL